MTYTAHYDSPLGILTLTSDGAALTKLGFLDNHEQPVSPEPLDVFAQTRRWLDIFFAGREPGFLPPLALHGTDFQKRVWQLLLEIPYGRTVSYGKLARRLGCRSVQAVGGAVGKNPVAIIVPCHRVIGSDGSPTGYAYGLERKRCLLQLEKSAI